MLLTGQSKLKLIVYAVFLIAIALAPLFMSDFRLSLLGKFLAYAIIAMGIDLIWGYTGILSLGHGVYFGLGAYCMAMHLEARRDARPTAGFHVMERCREITLVLGSFPNAGAAFLLALIVPMIVAFILGYFTFRNRIKGAFFSILSQAFVIITVRYSLANKAIQAELTD